MLRELSHVRQVRDDYFRRCFSDEALNLVVWYKPDQSIYGFQLSYDPSGNHRALTWTEDTGPSHASIDDGEDNPLINRAAILQPNADLDSGELLAGFRAAAVHLPAIESNFVQQKLAALKSKNPRPKRSAF